MHFIWTLKDAHHLKVNIVQVICAIKWIYWAENCLLYTVNHFMYCNIFFFSPSSWAIPPWIQLNMNCACKDTSSIYFFKYTGGKYSNLSSHLHVVYNTYTSASFPWEIHPLNQYSSHSFNCTVRNSDYLSTTYGDCAFIKLFRDHWEPTFFHLFEDPHAANIGLD